MSRKSISLAVTFLLVLSSNTHAYNGQGVIMTDAELDEVYAGGLNLNFDSFLGSVGSNAENVSKGGFGPTTSSSNAVVINSNNPNVQIMAPTPPQAPMTPASPTNPFTPFDPISPLAVESPVAPFSPIDPTSPVSSVDPALPMSPALAAVPTAPVSPAIPAAPSSPALPADPASPSGVASVAAPNSPNLPNAPDSPLSPSEVAGVVSPNAPNQPTTPNAPMVLDVFASTNGKFQVALDTNSGITPMAFNNNGGVYNSLNVTDTAQQNLSAVVNVNAAGSVVPVQVNLTVLMNSTVENLTNSNDLNLSHYSVFQVQ